MSVRLAALFGDNMVLQQGMPVPVWGWARPGEKIAVAVAGAAAEAVADGDGRWRATLPALAAGGPFEMTVAGEDVVAISNVMVGEVWIASGQSNMQMALSQTASAAEAIAGADLPGMRLFTVPVLAKGAPQDDVKGRWEACSPSAARDFSAVAYYFGREVHEKLGVPVGMIHSSLGGSAAEPWTSREGLQATPELRHILEEYDRVAADPEATLADFRVRLAEWHDRYLPKDPGNAGEALGWADPTADVSGWGEMKAPGMWQGAGLAFNGVVWFRKDVDIPESWAGRELALCLGPCDDFDTTYFNNVRVGGIGPEVADAWNRPREYTVPGRLVRAGRNVVTVRIFDHYGGGGFTGSAELMKLSPVGLEGASPIPLAGPWRYKVEHNFGMVQAPPGPQAPPMPGDPWAPSNLYNAMIAPLVPYAIRGAIWYQGESNAPRAFEYRTLFRTLIRDWRAKWGQKDFAFLFVQLANFTPVKDEPAESEWAELREAQLMALGEPATAMASAVDIGDAVDIHPTNKRDVGARLALGALAVAYGRDDVVHSGPIQKTAVVEGDSIRLGFDHVGGGLAARGGDLAGFAIAGEDRKFVWAKAMIEGDTVVVRSAGVRRPVAVRYAWADNPVCNLYNREGLTASPFRTDDWPGLTRPR